MTLRKKIGRKLDRLESRLTRILIFLPPTLGVILGGVVVSGLRRLTGEEVPRLPHDYVTLGMGIFCVVGLGLVGYLSYRVYRGAPTRFPRLLRLAPLTAVAGLIFGLVIAWLKATGGVS